MTMTRSKCLHSSSGLDGRLVKVPDCQCEGKYGPGSTPEAAKAICGWYCNSTGCV